MSHIETRLLGCKTKQPLSFIVCGQFISRAGFIHHRRMFDENVLIMITEGTIYKLTRQGAYRFRRAVYPAARRRGAFRISLL